jgi:hypothetical protein
MRAAPATGALYPIEIYVVSQDISGLRAGVYHFCPGDFSLTKLRGGGITALRWQTQLGIAHRFYTHLLRSPLPQSLGETPGSIKRAPTVIGSGILVLLLPTY